MLVSSKVVRGSDRSWSDDQSNSAGTTGSVEQGGHTGGVPAAIKVGASRCTAAAAAAADTR